MNLPKPKKINAEKYVAGLSLFKRKAVKIKLSANESALGPSPRAIKEFQKHSNQRILGEVLSGNLVSGKVFESLGFNLEIKDGNKIYTT